MKLTHAAWLLVNPLMFIVVATQAAWSQLPPTTMGKFVHQPGDNQYGRQAQLERHAVGPFVVPEKLQYSARENVSTRLPKPDVSLDPIAADEPVTQSGFPPLPYRLDLPVVTSCSDSGLGGGKVSRPNESFDSWASRAVPNASEANVRRTTCGGTIGALHLNPHNDQSLGSDAPTSAVLSQARTQDLSIDDDFSYKQSPSVASKFMQFLYQKTLQGGAQRLYNYGNLIRF